MKYWIVSSARAASTPSSRVRSVSSRRPFVAAAAAETLSWQARLARDLKRAGALVLDVFPRDLSPALINRYLEIKARQML